jgi:L-fucono-1,5-lactonase
MTPVSMPMRIDAHQHFWRYEAAQYPWIDDAMATLRRDYLPADLGPELARAGIDATMAVQACQTAVETEWLLELAATHPFIAGVVGWVDLRSDTVPDTLARLAANPKLVGIRHIVQSEPDDRFLLRSDFCRGIAVLRGFDLPYDILIYPRHLPVAIDFVARFDDQPFVLDHLAKPEIRSGAIETWARNLARLAAAPNVCCKLSGLVTEADWKGWTPDQILPYLDVAFDCFGADRLIAGSDWPVCTVAADYRRTMAVVTDYLERRSPSDREAVLGGNARRVWRRGSFAGMDAQEHIR